MPIDLRQLVLARLQALGMSRAELARACTCSRATINHWLAGHTAAIGSDTLAEILEALGIALRANRPQRDGLPVACEHGATGAADDRGGYTPAHTAPPAAAGRGGFPPAIPPGKGDAP